MTCLGEHIDAGLDRRSGARLSGGVPQQAGALPDGLHAWPRLSLRFTALSQGLKAASHFGSAWHGGIGLWLRDCDPVAYQALYEGPADAVKPYLLMPPEQEVSEGRSFSLEIKLFGSATQHHAAVVAAVGALGQAGIGPGRGKFSLVNVQSQSIPWDTSPGPERAVLELLTPTLIKANGHVLHAAPELSVVMQRALGRLAHLGYVLAPEMKQWVLAAAQGVIQQRADVRWCDSPRYSARQQAWMPFGGLQGSIHYLGVGANLWPWLRLVENINLGNKTTFGHGQVKFWPVGGQFEPFSHPPTCLP